MALQMVLWIALLSFQRIRGEDDNSTTIETYLGCSFSSADDWCNNTNVYDGSNGPQWTRQKAPAEQNPNPQNRYAYDRNGRYGYYQYGTFMYDQYGRLQQDRLTLYGTYAMDWPPKGDHYLYTGPTQSNIFAEMFAELLSPVIVVNNDTRKCLYFSYHNRIPIRLTPTLFVRMRNGNSSAEDDVVLAEFYSMDSQKWFEAQVPLPSGEYSLVFAGKNYNSRAISGGQLAITNIAILNGSCARTVAEWLASPGDCGFEDRNLCGYSYANDSTVRLLGLLAESLPSIDLSQRTERKLPDDRFLAMTSKFHEIANQGDKARLQSPEITIANEGCIYLWYYNSVQSKTDESNALNIVQLELFNEKVLFRLPIPKSNRNKWFQFSGALPRGTYRLILELVYTTDFAENDYAAFDNIEIFNKSCSDVKSLSDVCSADIPLGRSLCGNGGSCISLGKKSFRCSCRDGFFGDRCEQAYYGCDVDPCQNGGTCNHVGKLEFKCQCQQGYDGQLCEKVKTCAPANETFTYALLISVTHENYGGIARFKCVDGFTKFGELTATCNTHSVWELQGRCLETNCGNPPSVSGMTLINITNQTLNGIAKYKCSAGYTTHQNQDVLFCRSLVHNWDWRAYVEFQKLGGHWINTNGYGGLSCHPIPNCGQPPVIANANVTVTSTLMHGVATYRCNSGYELNINEPSSETICSQHGQWINAGGIGLQCFMLPDCGPPPKIPFAFVNYTDTSIDSIASYECKSGYRLIGSETAVCWRIGENRLLKWVDWLFVPRCELNCPAKVGQRGNITVAKFKVSTCSLSGFDRFSTSLTCGPAVVYSVNRRLPKNTGEREVEKIVFYGSDLCISEKVEKVKYYGQSEVSSSVKCKAICFQYPFEIRDIVVYEQLRYIRDVQPNIQMSPLSGRKGISDIKVGQTTRQQKIMRYECVSP